MGTYADSLLTEGESVVMRERQHPLSLILDARAAVALWIVAAVLLLVTLLFNVSKPASDVLGYGILIALVLGILVFILRWWQWRTEEYLVTSRRLMKVTGILNKRAADSSLEKINDAILEQNVIARMLDYGDLDILTAAEVAVDRYRMLNHAKTFKKEMLTAKHALEHEVSYVSMPSPPLRGGAEAPQAPAMTMAHVSEAASAPAYAPPSAAETYAAPVTAAAAPAEVIDTTEEVTDALARLADLRDQGAITAEEYEAKKSELLGRL